MSLQWFRTYSRMVDDDKVRLLAFEDRWHFVALLCCKCQGLLDEPGPLMRRKVAVKLGLDQRELDEVVRRISEVGLISARTLQPTAWDKLQFVSDLDPTRNERQRRFRDRAKRTGNALHNGPVTRTEADTEADTEAEPQQPSSMNSRSPVPLDLPIVPAGEKIRQPPAAKNGTAMANKPTGSLAWGAYASAYLDRYRTEPVRNAKVNGQFAQLAKRLPGDEIEHVVRWYVSSNASHHVRSKHCVDLLLRDCEGLRTEWATGARMTDTEARQIDQHDAGAEAARWVTENMDQLRQARREGKI